MRNIYEGEKLYIVSELYRCENIKERIPTYAILFYLEIILIFIGIVNALYIIHFT